MFGLVEFNATFVFQIINTLVMFLLLRHFLFKPVTEMMENRTKSIEDSFKEAEVKVEESEKLKSEYETKLNEIKKERNKMIEDATLRARNRSEEIIAAAEEEADRLAERAKAEIERERQKMMNELKGEISKIAISAAEKVIEKDLDENTHKELINNFIDKAGETQWQN